MKDFFVEQIFSGVLVTAFPFAFIAFEREGALIWPNKSADRIKESCLSGAIGADNSDNFIVIELKIDIMQCAKSTEGD